MDCPLCLEEIDLSDANFKPCPCGYQVSFPAEETKGRNRTRWEAVELLWNVFILIYNDTIVFRSEILEK